MNIAQGLLSEDDFLLSEILFNPYTPGQLINIRERLRELLAIVEQKDSEGMKRFLSEVRKNIE
jgi:prephenate dehydrogenase